MATKSNQPLLSRLKKSIIHTIKFRKLNTLNFIVLTVLGLILLYPLFYAAIVSVCTMPEFLQSGLLPKPMHATQQLKNYLVLFKQEGIVKALGVTAIRMVWGFCIPALTSVLGGYAFAKLDFPFKRAIFLIMLSTMMVPGVAMMIPNYIWLTKFPFMGGNNLFGKGGTGFIDNPLYLFLTGWVGAYNIFLFRQAFVGIGKELAESAQIDGANLIYIIFRIYMPLVSPLLVVLLLGACTGAWNDYMTNLIYLPNRPEWQSIGYCTIGLAEYYLGQDLPGGADVPKAYAILTIMMVPPVILFICVQRKFVAGLTAGAVKG